MKNDKKHQRLNIDLFNLENEKMSEQTMDKTLAGVILDPPYLICDCQHYMGDPVETMHAVR